MATIHVNDAEAHIIQAALSAYADSIRQEARSFGGGYSARAIELNVLRLNVEAVLELMNRPAAPMTLNRVVPIDAAGELAAPRGVASKSRGTKRSFLPVPVPARA